jgi:hypothetical protein
MPSNADAKLAHVVRVLVLEDRPERFGAGVVLRRTGLSHGVNDCARKVAVTSTRCMVECVKHEFGSRVVLE